MLTVLQVLLWQSKCFPKPMRLLSIESEFKVKIRTYMEEESDCNADTKDYRYRQTADR